jgi:hypothetical protein
MFGAARDFAGRYRLFTHDLWAIGEHFLMGVAQTAL